MSRFRNLLAAVVVTAAAVVPALPAGAQRVTGQCCYGYLGNPVPIPSQSSSVYVDGNGALAVDVVAGGGATSSIMTPSAADGNATVIAAANTWQTLFAAGYGVHGTYITAPTATVCVGTLGQTGACTCPPSGGAQNIFVVAAGAGLAGYGVNSGSAMSICSATAGATFTKGGY